MILSQLSRLQDSFCRFDRLANGPARSAITARGQFRHYTLVKSGIVGPGEPMPANSKELCNRGRRFSTSCRPGGRNKWMRWRRSWTESWIRGNGCASTNSGRNRGWASGIHLAIGVADAHLCGEGDVGFGEKVGPRSVCRSNVRCAGGFPRSRRRPCEPPSRAFDAFAKAGPGHKDARCSPSRRRVLAEDRRRFCPVSKNNVILPDAPPAQTSLPKGSLPESGCCAAANACEKFLREPREPVFCRVAVFDSDRRGSAMLCGSTGFRYR